MKKELASIKEENEICGWEFSKNMTTDIVIKALKKLVSNVEKSYQKQLFIRMYTSKDYVAAVLELGCKLSYSRKGNLNLVVDVRQIASSSYSNNFSL
ncbi:hypothetical protein [Cetobacterium sp.]|uniref:hypothetical protein n=1 Tax=Cetobacterium sp. TaxID=2071632 RepID=UPI003AF012DC